MDLLPPAPGSVTQYHSTDSSNILQCNSILCDILFREQVMPVAT